MLLLLGVPIAFALGGVTVVFALLLWGPNALIIIPQQVFQMMMRPTLMAVPLFLLLAFAMQKSGVAEALFDTLHHWMGPLKGGLAMATVVISTIYAAMSGISAVATVAMGVTALPAMLKRGYNKTIALGSVMAGGARRKDTALDLP